jgi:hypothetical protein
MITQKYIRDFTEREKKITESKIVSLDLSGIKKESKWNDFCTELYVLMSVLVLTL